MKQLLISLFTILTFLSAWSQTANDKYDAKLAEQLGGDEYGMKMYVFVLLKSGENKTNDQAFISEAFDGHLKNIGRLAEEKKIIVAGPFAKNEDDFRGLFILNVPTIEEGRTLLETDPAIKAKLLRAELYPWYGSAALSEYLESHDKIWKINP